MLNRVPLRRFLLLVASLLAAGLVSPAAMAAWEVTRFKVYEGPPVDAPDWREQEAGGDDPSLSPVTVREIENFLYATANLYSNLGFADPSARGAFDSIFTDENGEKTIRVYVYPRDDAPAGWYSSGLPCSSPKTSRRIININSLLYEGGKGIADANYQTLAHEMVHAIQKVSAFIRPGTCGLGQWFAEGTADALGYYAARKLRNLKFRKEMEDQQFIKVFGARPYSYPLSDPPKGIDTAYTTSSFWRYLAELAWSSAHGKQHPGSAPVKENWKYLAQFYKSEFPYRSTPISEITWINQLMKSSPLIHANLATVYARFVASFADIINARVGPLGLVPKASEREPRWLKRVFAGCPFTGAVGGNYQQTVYSRNMAPNSAACFFTKVAPGARGKTLRIQVSDKNEAMLEQLRIGMLDGSFTAAPMIANGTGSNPVHIATWSFPVIRNASMTFIVSNMATQPALTRLHTHGFHLSVGNFQHTLGGGRSGPVPPPPVYGPQQTAKAKVPAPKASKPTRRERFQQQQREALKNPAENLAPVTSAERKRYDRASSCTPSDRRLKRCDARLRITLALSVLDAKYNMLHLADGNLMSLMMSGDGVRSRRLIDETLEGIDGSKVTIEVPAIEYGFTGAINNASIQVSKAHGGDDDYIAYGPTQWAGPRAYHRPPNGRVFIEEYQPMVLRGRFSADLIDESNAGPDDAPIVAESIEGKFLVAAPWLGDEDNFQLDEAHTKAVAKEQMLLMTPFAAQAVQEEVSMIGAPPPALCESDVSAEQIKAMGFPAPCGARSGSGEGSVIAAPQCSCSCDSKQSESPKSACAAACAADWAQCEAPAEIPDDLEQQVAMYRQNLVSHKLPERMVAALTQAFRKAPPFQRKAMLEDARK